MSQGQIKLDTPFGKLLYDICLKSDDIRTVVEIGTWYGMGSTECIIRGLQDSKKEGVSFLSIESYKEMYDVAVQSWGNNLPSWAKLKWGHIIAVSDLDSENLGYQHPDESVWFQGDKNSIVSSPYLLPQIPEKIDFLFLDGGEFSTTAEFYLLKDRCKMIALDDTRARKCTKIRDYVLANKDTEGYEILFDDINHRNGVMIFRKK